MSLITFFTSLFNIGLGIGETIAIAGYRVLLFIDALVYTLVAYTFKIFLLIANINFNSLNAIMEPVVSRAKALIIVFIVYRIGIALITYLADPEKYINYCCFTIKL